MVFPTYLESLALYRITTLSVVGLLGSVLTVYPLAFIQLQSTGTPFSHTSSGTPPGYSVPQDPRGREAPIYKLNTVTCPAIRNVHIKCLTQTASRRSILS
jgi:hypothetical protein